MLLYIKRIEIENNDCKHVEFRNCDALSRFSMHPWKRFFPRSQPGFAPTGLFFLVMAPAKISAAAYALN